MEINIFMYTSFAEGKRGRDAIYDNINFKLQRVYIYIYICLFYDKMAKNNDVKTKILRFRNYKPQSEIPETTIIFNGNNYNVDNNNNNNNDNSNIEMDLSEPYKEEESIRLAPREMNGDLKKGLESKLQELEKRTKLAIYEMLTKEVSQNNTT